MCGFNTGSYSNLRIEEIACKYSKKYRQKQGYTDGKSK